MCKVFGVFLVVLGLVGCSPTQIIVEKSTYVELPSHLLDEPEPKYPPNLYLISAPTKLETVTKQRDALLLYSRELMIDLQGLILNVRKIKELDNEQKELNP